MFTVLCSGLVVSYCLGSSLMKVVVFVYMMILSSSLCLTFNRRRVVNSFLFFSHLGIVFLTFLVRINCKNFVSQ